MSQAVEGKDKRRILASLGLHRRDLRAWAMYDWALSAQETTIAVAVFPIFFSKVAVAGLPEGAGSTIIGYSHSLATLVIALISPILGAIADYAAVKKRMLAAFMVMGVISIGLMFFIQSGDYRLGSLLFILSLIGGAGSRVFYEALLPDIASHDEVDRVSTAGYALGYVGGGILLALNLAWILKPALFGLPSGTDLTPSQGTLPTRLALVSVAVWWLLFSIPLFRKVPEPPPRLEPDEVKGLNPVKVGFGRLMETFHELRLYKHAFILLLAFLIYNDGISTIQKMATVYGDEIGIGQGTLISAILLVQFVGIPCSFLFGSLAGRIGTKPSIYVGLGVYTGISIFGFFMSSPTHFYILAGLVGLVQGGTQALSRSLFATIIPRHKSGEFFGFFSVFSKFAATTGPLVFIFARGLMGESRYGILSIILFFIVGGILLAFVDVEEGERAARAAEKAVRVAPVEAGAGA